MTASRNNGCKHPSKTSAILVLRWCVRCSGWRYLALQERPEEESGTYGHYVGIDDGFWPMEDGGPEDLIHLAHRMCRSTMEAEADALSPRLFAWGD